MLLAGALIPASPPTCLLSGDFSSSPPVPFMGLLTRQGSWLPRSQRSERERLHLSVPGLPWQNPPDWEASTIEEAYFSQFWRLEVPVEVSAGVVSPEASVLALQMVSFLLGTHGFCSVYASPYFIPLSIRTPVLLGSSLSWGHHLTKTLSPGTVIVEELGVKASTYELRGQGWKQNSVKNSEWSQEGNHSLLYPNLLHGIPGLLLNSVPWKQVLSPPTLKQRE